MGDPTELRIRTAYDIMAEDYTELFRYELPGSAHGRAVLALFAELVRTEGGARVGDLGCGPGRLFDQLGGLGLDVVGVDLSPGMVAVARRDHRRVPTLVGSLAALPLADASLDGAVCWYSLIHTAPGAQRPLLAELRRVLRPGGHLLVATQVGADHEVHLDHVYGHDVDLDVHRLDPDRLADDLAAGGLSVDTTILRAPRGQERQDQAYLLARRPTRR